MSVLKPALVVLMISFSVSACASHRIHSAEPDPVGVAGEPFEYQSISYFGRSGLSSAATGYPATNECEDADLADVEVRRNFGQGVITVLTLGMVAPTTVYFYCGKTDRPIR